jgi:hypothetical protein
MFQKERSCFKILFFIVYWVGESSALDIRVAGVLRWSAKQMSTLQCPPLGRPGVRTRLCRPPGQSPPSALRLGKVLAVQATMSKRCSAKKRTSAPAFFIKKDTAPHRRDFAQPQSGWRTPHLVAEDFDKVEPPGRSPGGVPAIRL